MGGRGECAVRRACGCGRLLPGLERWGGGRHTVSWHVLRPVPPKRVAHAMLLAYPPDCCLVLVTVQVAVVFSPPVRSDTPAALKLLLTQPLVSLPLCSWRPRTASCGTSAST